LLGAGIAGLLLVLAQGPAWGWTSAATLAGAVTSVALLAVWIGWEQRARHPLVELRPLGRRPGAGFPRTPVTALPPESASSSWSPRWPSASFRHETAGAG
jgi:hypothetical protein